MTDREPFFAVTIPAGTAKAAPVSTDLPWADGVLTKLHVTIPSGHAGLTGYQFAYDGQQLIPVNVGAFIIDNDAKIEHDIAVPMVGGRWQLVAYNTDEYDHTFYVRAEINEIPKPAATATLPITVTATPPTDTETDDTTTLDELLADAPADTPAEPAPEVAP